VSNDRPRVPDENELLAAGKLSPNLAEGTKRVELHVVDARMRKIGEPAEVAAEKALLAAFLWSASNAPDVLRASAVQDILPDRKPFYETAHGEIYEAMLACLAKIEETGHTPVEHDPVQVASHAAKLGYSSDRTGIGALEKLQSSASTVSEVQARAYAESIKSAWTKREAIRGLRRVVESALDPRISDIEIYRLAEKASADIMERSSAIASTISLKQSAEQFFTDLMAPTGAAVPTGLNNIDEMINGGLRAPETSILAARTNVGKSTIAVQIAEHMVASDPKVGALYVTMEMPHKSFTTKLLAARTPGVSVAAIRRKVLNTDQWRDLTASVKSVKDLELWFTVSLEQTLVSVLSAATDRARILDRAGKKLTLVVIDHIGLVKPSAELLKKGTREQQVAETSRGLRVIATKLGCHVMALAQIHRDAERQKNADAMPKLHHLRESGSLEQDADQIFIMHRPRDPMSGIFIKGKPTAFALAKGRLDETSITLLEFERGRYIDTLKDYDDEYKDGDE